MPAQIIHCLVVFITYIIPWLLVLIPIMGWKNNLDFMVRHVDQIIAQRICRRFCNKSGIAGSRKIQNHILTR